MRTMILRKMPDNIFKSDQCYEHYRLKVLTRSQLCDVKCRPEVETGGGGGTTKIKAAYVYRQAGVVRCT